MTSITAKKEETKKLLRSVLIPNKYGITMSDVDIEYRKVIGSPIPYKSLGYPSLKSMLLDMNDVVSLKESSNMQILLYAIPHQSTKHISNTYDTNDNLMDDISSNKIYRHDRLLSSNAPVNSKNMKPVKTFCKIEISPRVQNNIVKMLDIHPKGLRSSQLLAEYRRLFSEDLDPMLYGFTNILELCASLSNLVDIRREEINSTDCLVLPVRSKDIGRGETGTVITTRSSLSHYSDFDYHSSLREPLIVGSTTDIIVSSIRSPSKIFIQLKENQEMFHGMMIRLQDLLDSYGKDLDVDEMKPNMKVACKLDGQTFRVVILQIKETAKVCCYDYGFTKNVPLSSLRPMPIEFRNLPAQSLPAKLAGIIPQGNSEWSQDACDFLKQKVITDLENSKCFSARIVQLPSKSTTLEINLFDSEGSSVNRKLIDAGFAIKAEVMFLGSSSSSSKIVNDISKVVQLIEDETSVSDEICTQIMAITKEIKSSLAPQLKIEVKNIGDKNIQTICKDGKYWTPSYEISRLIPEWKGLNLLEPMLSVNKLDFTKTYISEENCPQIWKQISLSTECKDPTVVSLYLLVDVPSIVSIFSKT